MIMHSYGANIKAWRYHQGHFTPIIATLTQCKTVSLYRFALFTAGNFVENCENQSYLDLEVISLDLTGQNPGNGVQDDPVCLGRAFGSHPAAPFQRWLSWRRLKSSQRRCQYLRSLAVWGAGVQPELEPRCGFCVPLCARPA